jgi:hypothetical protein
VKRIITVSIEVVVDDQGAGTSTAHAERITESIDDAVPGAVHSVIEDAEARIYDALVGRYGLE